MRAAQRVHIANRYGPPAFAPVILLACMVSDILLNPCASNGVANPNLKHNGRHRRKALVNQAAECLTALHLAAATGPANGSGNISLLVRWPKPRNNIARSADSSEQAVDACLLLLG